MLILFAHLNKMRNKNELVRQRISKIDLILPLKSSRGRNPAPAPLSPYAVRHLRKAGVKLNENPKRRNLAVSDFFKYNVILTNRWRFTKEDGGQAMLEQASRQSLHHNMVARLIFLNQVCIRFPRSETIYASTKLNSWWMPEGRAEREERETIDSGLGNLLNTCRALLVREFGLLYRLDRFHLRKGATLPDGPFKPYYFDDESPDEAERNGHFEDSEAE